MAMRSMLRRAAGARLKQYPRVWSSLVDMDLRVERARHTLARSLPVLIRPEPRHLEVAITAHCNLRCIGCRYGREFMPGSQLPLPVVRQLLDDAKEVGMWDVRFYGGEPLLHPDLPAMVRHAVDIGLGAYVTTNGMLLERRIDELYDAGLRTLNIGYYGTGAHYDAYVQRRNRFDQLERSLAALRDGYGDEIRLRLNWLLMRPSCSIEALHAAWAMAERFDARFQVDLIHYSLPYFTEGPDRVLQFTPDDEPAIRDVVAELVRLKEASPERFNQSMEGIRSIPDWLLLGPDMRVPCDSHQMLWVGADGTVQQCYVTYHLGNLHEARLRDMLFTPAHNGYARDSFELGCPNCHCHYDVRVQKHEPSRARYSQPMSR
ncbi:MAG TPA: radical SAM protein [Longimicrobiales bacterium]|nr:radical SAM protein [Longimicrobiales bacterium]